MCSVRSGAVLGAIRCDTVFVLCHLCRREVFKIRIVGVRVVCGWRLRIAVESLCMLELRSRSLFDGDRCLVVINLCGLLRGSKLRRWGIVM